MPGDDDLLPTTKLPLNNPLDVDDTLVPTFSFQNVACVEPLRDNALKQCGVVNAISAAALVDELISDKLDDNILNSLLVALYPQEAALVVVGALVKVVKKNASFAVYDE